MSLVSIHAPVWGATHELAHIGVKRDVSIHAPVWGATYESLSLKPYLMFQSTHPCGVRHRTSLNLGDLKCFNPRTRVGCDKSIVADVNKSMVSIHAPVWGATMRGVNKTITIGFNPRTRVGCDRRQCGDGAWRVVSIHAPVWGATVDHNHLVDYQVFQSTHPCGVRLSIGLPLFWSPCFNPRTRVGCDIITLFNKYHALFQSTHPCGVRPHKF